MGNHAMKIFRAGTHISASGEQVTLSKDDLEACAKAYDKSKHEAPFVIGHPKENAPAWGWVDHLEVDAQGGLNANAVQVDPAFSEMVQNGRYKKVSASFYKPDSPINPVIGVWYLRHVGILGAVPPAIKGLGDAVFSELEGTIELEFNEMIEEKTPVQLVPITTVDTAIEFAERGKELDAREAKINLIEKQLQRDSNGYELEKIIASGRAIGSKKEELLDFMEVLTGRTVDFTEEKQVDLRKWFLEFLQTQTQQVDFNEHTKETGKEEKLSVEAIAKLAQKKALDEGIRFSEAVKILWKD